jgi:glutathione peroxidase
MPTIAEFSAAAIDGEEQPLSQYLGKVVLIVNTASKCGFTPQYAGLESVYKAYEDRGLVVLGFPCDQFGHQEPGGEAQIEEFCKVRFGVTFPLFAKVDVNGAHAHPLYRWLRTQQAGLLGDSIKWNFTKFLLNREGKVVKRYASTTTPERITKDIEALLG